MAQAPVPCDLCTSEEDVSYYCITCSDTLCGKCKIIHERGKKTRNDEIIPLSEVNQRRLPKRPLILCGVHSTEEITFHCEICSTFICNECLVEVHNTHKITTVKKFTDLKTDELNNTLKLLNDKKVLYQNVLDTETGNHQQLLTAIEQCRKDINNHKSKVIEKFIKEVDIAYNGHISELTKLKEAEDDRYV